MSPASFSNDHKFNNTPYSRFRPDCIGHLLCARAIENGLTVLGADQYAPGKFVGHSMAFQPDGTALGELGEEQDLLIVKIY